jgi:hypothetical protein
MIKLGKISEETKGAPPGAVEASTGLFGRKD